MTAPALTLDQINRMESREFSRVFGRVFEHSPWIAERSLTARPFASIEALHQAMCAVVRQASAPEQRALLVAHPALAGREALAGELTPESTREQAAAGLDALSRAEMDHISRMNQVHAERFGFPFIIAVRLNTKARIFSEFERRLALDQAAEERACLEQVYLITGLRLRELVSAQD